MPTIEALVQSIDCRIRELHDEIASLQNARKALSSNGSPATAPKPRAKPTRKQAFKPEVAPAGKLVQLLAGSDGMSAPALAKQANANRDQVLILLRELEKAGQVQRTGERRATRWFAVTDEDRIRERAAELEKRTRRAEP